MHVSPPQVTYPAGAPAGLLEVWIGLVDTDPLVTTHRRMSSPLGARAISRRSPACNLTHACVQSPLASAHASPLGAHAISRQSPACMHASPPHAHHCVDHPELLTYLLTYLLYLLGPPRGAAGTTEHRVGLLAMEPAIRFADQSLVMAPGVLRVKVRSPAFHALPCPAMPCHALPWRLARQGATSRLPRPSVPFHALPWPSLTSSPPRRCECN